MRPPIANSSTSSNHQDPVHLPKELFVKILNSLSSKSILDASLTDRDWRNVILSSPTLFSSIFITDPGFPIDDVFRPTEQVARAHRTINKLIRWSSLSNNRVTEANLSIMSFSSDPSFVSDPNWDATKISMLFNILNLSTNTLKKLDIEFPIFVVDSESIESEIMQTANMVHKLRNFKSLQKVRISAEVAIDLEPGSSKHRSIVIKDARRDHDSADDRYEDVWISSFQSLIQQVMAFTGKPMRRLICNTGASLDLEALRELEQSKESLEEVSLEISRESQAPLESFAFALGCPNLISLGLRVGDYPDLEEEGIYLRFPLQRRSELRSFTLYSSGDWGVDLDDGFFNWVGNESLSIFDIVAKGGYRNTFLVNCKALQSLLLSSQSSLTYLRLVGFHLLSTESAAQDQLQLLSIYYLNLRGHVSLVNFLVSTASYASLTGLVLVTEQESNQSEMLDHDKVVHILKACRLTLRTVEIEVKGPSPSHPPEKKWEDSEVERMRKPQELSLPELQDLRLFISDKDIEEFYLSINYPGCFGVELPSTSRFSKASFLTGR